MIVRSKSLGLCLAVLTSLLIVVEANAVVDPLAKLWAGEALFQEQPEQIGNFNDHMHFISMFWDSDPVDTPGSPHFKSYYIGNGPGGTFTTELARSFDGINFTNVGTVLPVGSSGAFDDRLSSFSSVWKDAGTYYLVYEGAGNNPMWPGDVGLATSTDGVNFTKQGLILNHLPGTFESANIGTPSLYKENNTWYLYYHGFDGADVQVGLATGTDLTNLTRVQSTPIIPTSLADWDSGTVGKRSRIIKEGAFYYMAYEGSTDQPFGTASWSTGLARSTDLINWDRLPTNPVVPETGSGFGFDGPEMLFVDNELYIYYRKGANQSFRAKLVLAGEPSLSRVLNSGFEIGNFLDWGFVTPSGAIVADNGPSVAGSNAASITTLGILGGFEQAVSKSIPIESGELLDFSFDYKTLAGATGDWRVQLRYWDGVGANGFSDGGGGNFLGEHTITLDPTDSLWLSNFLTALPNPNPAATHVDIRVIANAFGIFDGTALVDNFILRKNVAGDFNEDGVVDGKDFLVLQRGLGSIFNPLHLAEWEATYGNVPLQSAATAVPEPTTLALILLAFAGFASVPWKKKLT